MLTDNQQQLIDNLVSEFTQMNKPKGSSNNPLNAIFEEFSADKRKAIELEKIANVKIKALQEQARLDLNQLDEYFDELGYGEFSKLIDRTDESGGSYDKNIFKLLLEVRDGKGGLWGSITIDANISFERVKVGVIDVYSNHKLKYKIPGLLGNDEVSCSDINSLLASDTFKTRCQDFFRNVSRFIEYSTK